MALILGSITVHANGTVTKSGECGTLFDLMEQAAANMADDFKPGLALPSGHDAVPRLRAQARLATTLATYMFQLLTVRAQVEISTSTGALQRSGGVDTTAPSATRHLPIV